MASRSNGSARRKKNIAEHQKERRRALQARHRATLAGLFDSLRNVVCPSSKKTPAKWKILHHAKSYLQKQEARFVRLLPLKEMFLLEDDGPCSLKEVREEYRHLYCQCRGSGPVMGDDSESSSDEDPTDDPGLSQSSAVSVSGIQEFEGYLFFYRQTVELLLGSGVLSPEQTGLPVVSEAISGLWRSLSPEHRAAMQSCSQGQGTLLWTGQAEEPPLPDTPIWSSQTNSQGASTSSGSTYEEDLQDAYDVVQKELDLTAADRYSVDVEKMREIYRNIMCFVRTQMSEEPEPTQDLCPDYEADFLRCTETFDEDL
ncbi:stimulated by retinoic acid gene 8 protein homolog [Megalops cyprinoides]|uniref:stimulated by retinoic acid gene 8 protein homolog n=1 Tax=Megalops cyprinoides TaxID=118141 RepID=UPI0018650C44|nr:stimulated by retinoic acid gene 8 protein homolog [Megalops cyprinoides]